MSKIDLECLSVEELRKVSAQAGELIQTKEDTLISEAYEEIKRLANSVNMTVDEIAVWAGNQSRKRKKVAMKYRNPKNPEDMWTGRGMKPRWVVDALAAGRELSEFLI